VEVADLADGQRIVGRAFDLTVDPGPRSFTDEADGLLNCGLSDPGVDSGVDNLGKWPGESWTIKAAISRNYPFRLYSYILESDRSACGRALTEP
jgi:hypothetical protein